MLCMFDYSRDTFLGQQWSQWHPGGWNQNSRLTSFEIFNSLRTDMNSNGSVNSTGSAVSTCREFSDAGTQTYSEAFLLLSA